MRKLTLSIVPLILASLFISTVLAQPSSEKGNAYGTRYPPPFLNGNWITTWDYTPEFNLPADEQCFVISGFIWENWPEVTGQEKASFMSDYRYELEINGEPIQMKKWKHLYKTFEMPTPAGGILEKAMLIGFYVQFDANHFLQDTYTFRGAWYGPEGLINEYEVTVTFY